MPVKKGGVSRFSSGESAAALLLRGLPRRRPSSGRRALLDQPLFEESVDVGLPKERPSAELREGEVALGHQLEEEAPGDSEILEDFGETEDFLTGLHGANFIHSAPIKQRKKALDLRRGGRVRLDLEKLKETYNDVRWLRKILGGAQALGLPDVRRRRSRGLLAGVADLVRWSHVRFQALSAGAKRGTGRQEPSDRARRSPMNKWHTFVLRCEECRRFYFFSRPRQARGGPSRCAFLEFWIHRGSKRER
jgi:hypothetical protein